MIEMMIGGLKCHVLSLPLDSSASGRRCKVIGYEYLSIFQMLHIKVLNSRQDCAYPI